MSIDLVKLEKVIEEDGGKHKIEFSEVQKVLELLTKEYYTKKTKFMTYAGIRDESIKIHKISLNRFEEIMSFLEDNRIVYKSSIIAKDLPWRSNTQVKVLPRSDSVVVPKPKKERKQYGNCSSSATVRRR